MSSNTNQIPLTRPWMGDRELSAVRRVLDSGWLTQGPRTEAFETVVAEAVGTRHAVATNSCTTALDLTLRCLGIEAGDEVIVPSLSFVATANAVLMQGARPIFCDVSVETFNLDPGKLGPLISERTKCVMPVDQMGMPCDMDAILAVTRPGKIPVVQDAACALGSLYRGEPVGRRAVASCFSFHPRKLVTTGEGGMIATDEDDLARDLRTVVSHGASVDEDAKHRSRKALLVVDYAVLGTNYRLSDVLGAIGAEQMKRLPEIVEKRNRWASLYGDLLSAEPRILPPTVPEGSRSNYQSYCVRLAGATAEVRDEIVTRLRIGGVQCTPGIQPIHRYTLYRDLFGETSLPNTELVADTTLIVPLFPQMTEEDVVAAARALIEAVRDVMQNRV